MPECDLNKIAKYLFLRTSLGGCFYISASASALLFSFLEKNETRNVLILRK